MSQLEDDVLMAYLQLQTEVTDELRPMLKEQAKELDEQRLKLRTQHQRVNAYGAVFQALQAWLNAIPQEVRDVLPRDETNALIAAIHNVDKLPTAKGPQ